MPASAEHSRQTGEALFLSNLALIERIVGFVCTRHHLPGGDPDDFDSHVKLKLVENDYAILNAFKRRSNLRTYLTVVITRLFFDYRISAWGKWRPSADAKRGGEVAVLLEQLLVRDGYGFEEACELLLTNHRFSVSRVELEHIAGQLPARVKRRFETDDSLHDAVAPGPSPDLTLEEGERRALGRRLCAALERRMAEFDSQDRLILLMRYEDGKTVADIAATLRLDQKRLYRRIEKLLTRLRAGLQADGFDAKAVAALLDSPTLGHGWGPIEGELPYPVRL
jgi:RNA polymerase sigma factor (sigma-70 family)